MTPRQIVTAAMTAVLLAITVPLAAVSQNWASGGALGDVLISRLGSVSVYDNNPAAVPSGTATTTEETLALAASTDAGAGMAFDEALNLYAIVYSAGGSARIVRFAQATPHQQTDVPTTGLCAAPQSIVFGLNATGGEVFYIGCRDGQILRYAAAGGSPVKFTVNAAALTNPLACMFIDLAHDQQTMFFTDGSQTIRRVNVSGDGDTGTGIAPAGITASSVFTTVPGSGSQHAACGLRLLPPIGGAGQTALIGGLIVADKRNVKVLQPNLTTWQTYLNSAGNDHFAIALDPNATDFWTLNAATGQAHKVSIAAGSESKVIRTLTSVGGLAINGEPTSAHSLRRVTNGSPDSLKAKYLQNAPGTGHVFQSGELPANTVLTVRALEVASDGQPQACTGNSSDFDCRLPAGPPRAIGRPNSRGRTAFYRVTELTTNIGSNTPTSVFVSARDLTASEVSALACATGSRSWRLLKASPDGAAFADITQTFYGGDDGWGGGGRGFSDFAVAGVCTPTTTTITNPQLNNNGTPKSYSNSLPVRVRVLQNGVSVDRSGHLAVTVATAPVGAKGDVVGSAPPDGFGATFSELGVKFFSWDATALLNQGNLQLTATNPDGSPIFVSGTTYNLCVNSTAAASTQNFFPEACVRFRKQ